MSELGRHKVQLLVSEWCTPCRSAEAIWQQVAERRDIAFEVLDMAQPEARTVAQRLSLRSVPAVVIDDKLMGVGVQTFEEALRLVADAPARKATPMRFVGITLSPSSRMALVASALYLAIGSSPLLLEGTLYGGSLSAQFVHILGIGFPTFMIFGLADHMLPRFTSRPIRMGWIVTLQHALGHAGVIGVAGGIAAASTSVVAAGGMLTAAGMTVFGARLVPVLMADGIDAEYDELGSQERALHAGSSSPESGL